MASVAETKSRAVVLYGHRRLQVPGAPPAGAAGSANNVNHRRPMTMRNVLLMLVMVSLVSAHARAAQPPELAKIKRQIDKQPSYTAEPLYGLFVFGPEAKTR